MMSYNKRWIMSITLVAGFMQTVIAHAAPPASAETEVNFLLGYVEKSGCEFYRNGTWHDSTSARAHLHDKYEYLLARNQIHAAEDFIDKAATKSSFSGQPYQVKCAGSTAVTSRHWLHDELARFRAHQKTRF